VKKLSNTSRCVRGLGTWMQCSRSRPLGIASVKSDRRFHVALFGIFGWGNFGNDATLDACMAALHPALPRSRIACIAAQPARVALDHGIAAFPLVRGRSFGGFLGRVIGEPVNEAARLCELSKDTPGHLLASSDAVSNADERERAHWTLGETVTLRGHDEPTRLALPV